MAHQDLPSERIRELLEEETSDLSHSESSLYDSEDEYHPEGSEQDSEDSDVSSVCDSEIDNGVTYGENEDSENIMPDQQQDLDPEAAPARGRRRNTVPPPEPWRQWTDSDVSFDHFSYNHMHLLCNAIYNN